MSYPAILAVTLPVLAALLAGWWARGRGWLAPEADASLLRLTLNVLYPCLIFSSVVTSTGAARAATIGQAMLAGFGAVITGFAVAWAGARAGRLPGVARRATFTFTTGLFNYGYLPVPLVQALFGASTLGVLFIFNVGVEFAMWTVGVGLLTARSGSPWWRRVATPPVAALAVAVTVNLLAPGQVPRPVVASLDLLGQASIPLGILLIGATLRDEMETARRHPEWRSALLAIALRLGLLPLAFIAIARLPFLPLELRQVLVVQAAMPAAVFPIVLAKHHGGHVPAAIWVVLGTTAVSLPLIPVWIRLGSRLAGLP